MATRGTTSRKSLQCRRPRRVEIASRWPAYLPQVGRGFTLVELLIVMLILGILVTLAVSVGQYRINQVGGEETRGIQQMILMALEAYYELHKEYPPDAGGGEDSSAKLLGALTHDKAVKEKLLYLKPEIFGEEGINDGWEKPMRYSATRGLGKQPVLESSGPDGDFGNRHIGASPQGVDGLKRMEDNVRSDGK